MTTLTASKLPTLFRLSWAGVAGTRSIDVAIYFFRRIINVFWRALVEHFWVLDVFFSELELTPILRFLASARSLEAAVQLSSSFKSAT